MTSTSASATVTFTDVPGASAADSVLGTSTCTVTSPDSSAWTRVSEPRKVAMVTMPFAPGAVPFAVRSRP